MIDGSSGPWFTERNTRNLAQRMSSADAPPAEFDVDLHLQFIRNPDKRVIHTLTEVSPQEIAKTRVLSPLHPARASGSMRDPFSPSIQIDTMFLLHLRDAYIGDNVVFDRERYFSFGRWWAGDDPGLYSQTETIEHIEAGAVVSAWMGAAFQHFVLDALVPLASIIELLESPGFEHYKIVSHDRDAPFAQWFWRKLGLQDRVVHKPINALERHVVHCDHVLFPHFSPSVGAVSIYPRHSLRPIQKRLELLNRSGQGLIIYADRSGGNRCVRNQDIFLKPLESLASRHGLEFVVFNSDGSWDDDLSLFSKARIVIGPHGGGLANIAFSPPGTHVIEFVPISEADISGKNQRWTHFYGLSQAAGHHYWAVEPEYFEFDEPEMQVDGNEIVKLVDQILSETAGTCF